MANSDDRGRLRGLLRRYPACAFFTLTFLVSWAAALGVAWHWLHRGHALPELAGILMFPSMLVGPSAIGFVMTHVVDGRAGLRALRERLMRWRLGAWYAVLLIPPLLVGGILLCLQHLVSPVFTPNLYLTGVLFGIPAGYLEEIGWTGFAFDHLRKRRSAFRAAVILGVLWSAWHLPVVDFLGTAYPHGSFWLPFFLAFGTAMTAMRVVISWVYVNTGSVLAAQLLHMTSTGALVVFSATGVDPAQEAGWYGVYAISLWLLVAIILCAHGPDLEHRRRHAATA